MNRLKRRSTARRVECPGNEASTWSEAASNKRTSPVGDPVAYSDPFGAADSAVTAALATAVSARAGDDVPAGDAPIAGRA